MRIPPYTRRRLHGLRLGKTFRGMHYLGVFSLGVKVAEEVEDIVRRGCHLISGSCLNDEDERVQLVGHPTFPYLPGAPFHHRQYMVPPCLMRLDIHDDWRWLWIPQSWQNPNRLNAELPTEKKLRKGFLLARGTKREPHQVTGHREPSAGYITQKGSSAGIVLCAFKTKNGP